MRHSHLVLFSLLSLTLASTVGCGGSETSARDRLIGKWELSTEQLRKTIKEDIAKNSKAANMDAAMSDEMLDKMVSAMAMSMDFQKDGKVVVEASGMGQDRTDEGTWEIVSVDGNTVTMKVTTSEGGGEPGTLTFIDNDTFELSPPKEQDAGGDKSRTITMKRIK